MMRFERTLTGYARAAVDTRIKMAEVADGQHMRAAWGVLFKQVKHYTHPLKVNFTKNLMVRYGVAHTKYTWTEGDTYVVAPAMTAVVVAAAESLNMTDLVINIDDAPTGTGIVFFPQTVYIRDVRGNLLNIAAITWNFVTQDDGRIGLDAVGWSDLMDPHDEDCVGIRKLIADNRYKTIPIGPYVLAHLERSLVGEHMPSDTPYTNQVSKEDDREWAPAPDGSFVMDSTASGRRSIITPLLYSFWHLQDTKIATTERPTVERHARKRAARAKVPSDVRIVTLRRSQTSSSTGDEAHWHYSVRFTVRGHWRHLTRPDGTTRRVWVNAHIKGPDGAPLLHGEKIFMLTR